MKQVWTMFRCYQALLLSVKVKLVSIQNVPAHRSRSAASGVWCADSVPQASRPITHIWTINVMGRPLVCLKASRGQSLHPSHLVCCVLKHICLIPFLANKKKASHPLNKTLICIEWGGSFRSTSWADKCFIYPNSHTVCTLICRKVPPPRYAKYPTALTTNWLHLLMVEWSRWHQRTHRPTTIFPSGIIWSFSLMNYNLVCTVCLLGLAPKFR